MCEHRRVARVVTVVKPVLVLAVAVHLRHRFHGPAFDYLGLAVAAAASFAGLPGPGEPLLIAAGIFAARHKLDIIGVIFVAWLAATTGGVIGWAIGWKAGRAVVTAPGPLHRFRVRVVERGEETSARHPVLAIILVPSFVAGINRVPPWVYNIVNATSALVWAAGIGLGAYFVGPAVVDAVSDGGTAITVIVIALIVGALAVRLWRRFRPSP